MKRWDLMEFTNRAGDYDAKMTPTNEGAWVRYTDLEHEGLVGSRFALLEAMARLEAELKSQGVTMTIKLEKDE